MSRNKFTADTLQAITERDGCEIDQTKIPDKIDGKSYISFVCKCGQEHSKRLDALQKSGALCIVCTKQSNKEKKAETREENRKRKLDSQSPIILRDQHGFETAVELNTILDLVIAPGILRPVLTDVMKHILYAEVRWWDIETFKHQTKGFRLDIDEVAGRAKAKEFYDALPWEKYRETTDHVLHISVEDILKTYSKFTRQFRLYTKVISYPEQDLPIPAWVLGVWLADGHADGPAFSNDDIEVVDGLRSWAESVDMVFVKVACENYKYRIKSPSRQHNTNIMMVFLRDYGLIKNKTVPDIYKFNSEHNRLELLAGMLDCDGYLQKTHLELTQCVAHEAVFDGIRTVAQSLGFRMTKRYKADASYVDKKTGERRICPAWRGNIMGDIKRIPMRVERKKCPQNATQRHDLCKFELINCANSS